MNKKPEDAPAFPCEFPVTLKDGSEKIYKHCGMTLRDYFAAAALTGLFFNKDLEKALKEVSKKVGEKPELIMARMAYGFAGAMLKERASE